LVTFYILETVGVTQIGIVYSIVKGRQFNNFPSIVAPAVLNCVVVVATRNK
jgi:hypothetical protein